MNILKLDWIKSGRVCKIVNVIISSSLFIRSFFWAYCSLCNLCFCCSAARVFFSLFFCLFFIIIIPSLYLFRCCVGAIPAELFAMDVGCACVCIYIFILLYRTVVLAPSPSVVRVLLLLFFFCFHSCSFRFQPGVLWMYGFVCVCVVCLRCCCCCKNVVDYIIWCVCSVVWWAICISIYIYSIDIHLVCLAAGQNGFSLSFLSRSVCARLFACVCGPFVCCLLLFFTSIQYNTRNIATSILSSWWLKWGHYIVWDEVETKVKWHSYFRTIRLICVNTHQAYTVRTYVRTPIG